MSALRMWLIFRNDKWMLGMESCCTNRKPKKIKHKLNLNYLVKIRLIFSFSHKTWWCNKVKNISLPVSLVLFSITFIFFKYLFIHATLSQALSEAPGMQVSILPEKLASCYGMEQVRLLSLWGMREIFQLILCKMCKNCKLR